MGVDFGDFVDLGSFLLISLVWHRDFGDLGLIWAVIFMISRIWVDFDGGLADLADVGSTLLVIS